MTSRIALVFVMVLFLGTTSSWAKKKHPKEAEQTEQTLIEVSPMSITVDAGKDVQEKYNVTGATTATLNGLSVNPRDLRAGMIAVINLAKDGVTVISITAKDAPRTTKKPVVHKDNVFINLH